jgi:hypothetical protein
MTNFPQAARGADASLHTNFQMWIMVIMLSVPSARITIDMSLAIYHRQASGKFL